MTVLKTSIPKSKPRQITCKDYKQLNYFKFIYELKNEPTIENIDDCIKFDKTFLENLDAPLNRKLLRANDGFRVLKNFVISFL